MPVEQDLPTMPEIRKWAKENDWSVLTWEYYPDPGNLYYILRREIRLDYNEPFVLKSEPEVINDFKKACAVLMDESARRNKK